MKCFHVPFLIADHLNGYELIVLVVQTFQDLSEGAFPNHFKHLKPVANVIVQHLEMHEKEHREFVSKLLRSACFYCDENIIQSR